MKYRRSEKSTDLEAKNQQNGNVNIKGKRVALEAKVEQRDTDVKGKRIALETEINQRDEAIKGKLTALDAENQKLRDEVIKFEEQYNKYRELTTLHCKFPNIKIPENVKSVIKKCKLDKILDAESSESCLSLVDSLSNQVTELEAENTMLKKEKAEWMSYSDYLDQEKDNFNGNIPNEFYKVLVDRRIENNILQEEMINIKKQMINKELIVSENENKVNKLRIERVQVIEYLLRRYKKELEQAQSNHKVNPNMIKILKCIEELQKLIYGLEDQNYKLLKKTMSLHVNKPKNTKSDEIFLKTINELQNENGSLQKNEAILKDTIFTVKNENSQKIKHLQNTTRNNHMENNDGVIANVIPTQSFMNLEYENKQLIEKY
ncbi:hypothetical protein C2G38_2036973 [Gigaspora rosea]|uniref:Uncharacterized protein n=1 Tax=Gigaspora rosea TaxID=44941 RepID=A0A397V8T9_9GLOM|nr:hypothetical protein C2G38_2036973 [Gigaspora rosea]